MVAAISTTKAIVLAGGLVLVWLVPYVIDQAASYRRDRKIRDTVIRPLIHGKTIDQLPESAVKELTSLLRDERPSGMTGLVRALLALTILSIVGVALFFTFSTGADAELQKTIVTAILAILGTIAGFYFGSKSVQDAAASSLQTALGAPATPSVASMKLDPPSVQALDTARVTVNLSSPAPMGGCVVELSSDMDAAQPPATLFFKAGESSASGDVTTAGVGAEVQATITASLSGSKVTTTGQLTVTP